MPCIRTIGVTVRTPADELQYLISHFAVMEHLDEYTFFVTCHIAEIFSVSTSRTCYSDVGMNFA